MSQDTVTNTNTTPPMTVTVAATSVHQTTVGQNDVVLPPQLIPMYTMRGSVGLTTMSQQQQLQSQMISQAYANYAMGPLQVSFSFRVEPSTNSNVICCCLLWCLLFAFRFPCGCHVHLWGLNSWGVQHHNPL